MKTSRFSILTVAALALAAFAGTAVAAPDILAQAWAVLTDPVAIGAVLAWGPMVRNLQAQHAAEVDGMTKIGTIALKLAAALGDGAAIPFTQPSEEEGIVTRLPGSDAKTIEKAPAPAP